MHTRISAVSHKRLKDLSESSGRPMQTLLDEAIEELDRKAFWQAVEEGYAKMKAEPEEWASYQEEIRIWDSTAADGLEGW